MGGIADEKKRKTKACKKSSKWNENVDDLNTYVLTPPDGGWGWVIVFASFFNSLIVEGIAYCFGVFYVEFLGYFKESKGKTALIGSLLTGTYMCCGPLVSALTNRYGCRVVTIAGSLIAAVAFLLSTLSPNINVLILTYGVMGGFGFGMIYLPTIVSVGYYFDKKRALSTGIAMCGSGVGTFIFAPLSSALLSHYDWKNAIFILAGLILNSCVLGALMRPLPSPTKTLPLHPKNNPLREAKSDGDFQLLTVGKDSLTDARRACSHNNLLSVDYGRPLYRQDIFYTGSLLNIPQYKSQPNMRSYIASTTHISSTPKIEDGETRRQKPCIDVLRNVLDIHILEHCSFRLICLANIFVMIGFYVPFVYITDRAVILGIDQNSASFLVSIMGIANSIGRLLFGFIADRPKVNALLVHNITMSVAAIATLLSPFCTDYLTLIIYCAMFGLHISAFSSLTSVILCDILGLAQLTTAFGVLTMVRGVSAIVGPPIAGAIFDETKSYDVPFYLSGSLILTGAILHFALFLPCMPKNRQETPVPAEGDQWEKQCGKDMQL